MNTTTENLTQNLSQQAQQKGNAIAEKLTETKHKAEEMFRHASEQVQENASHINEAVIDYVKAKPFTALCIAAGVGLLLGAALRR
jgi:ElaB/YqjD/DUF883 family membrane-anchored ribosome-binding protein